ncbi:MAG: hypothetical protein M3301_09920 [Chloroflexota bacterium]|nr:hypothetical protein [Chloroflexota bacterium]
MEATGLSSDPEEYRRRIEGQPDEQIDAWSAELMRDMSIRRGVRRVLKDFMTAARLDPLQLERVYAAGGGPPASVGRTDNGEVMVPAIALHCLVAGLRRETPDARSRLTEYIVANFEEFVYI